MSYEFDDREFPLAYLITFRAYGTWLHGDERGSVNRAQNIYGTPRIAPNENLQSMSAALLKHAPLTLNTAQREAVEFAVKGVCAYRGYGCHAVNARTNHVHVVVSAACQPEPVIEAFKSYATRKLRNDGWIARNVHIWERGGSRRYLWKERHVARAIEYVLYEQGDEPPDFDDWLKEAEP